MCIVTNTNPFFLVGAIWNEPIRPAAEVLPVAAAERGANSADELGSTRSGGEETYSFARTIQAPLRMVRSCLRTFSKLRKWKTIWEFDPSCYERLCCVIACGCGCAVQLCIVSNVWRCVGVDWNRLSPAPSSHWGWHLIWPVGMGDWCELEQIHKLLSSKIVLSCHSFHLLDSEEQPALSFQYIYCMKQQKRRNNVIVLLDIYTASSVVRNQQGSFPDFWKC